MDETVAAGIWLLLAAHGAVGLCVLLWLSVGGLKRLDPVAASAPLRVKLLIAPGLVALWPLILRRALGAGPVEDRG